MAHAAPITTLRDWLDRLAGDGRLALIEPRKSLRFEIAAIASRLDGQQATFFPMPEGHGIPVLSGIVSRREWIAEAMGVPQAELLGRYQQAVGNPVPCREVAEAPVQEVVHRDAIDIGALLPAPVHNEHDGGAYLTAGLLVSANPETGRQNVSINRCHLKGGNRMGVSVSSRDTGTFLNQCEKAGKPLPIAIAIGVDPLTLMASQALVAMDQDELEVAGALRGEAVRVVKCLTNDLRVPADAEIVLEGRILPNVREPEGPFGEFTQYYGPRGDRFVIEIDAITHRRSPIFHTIIGGGTEHILLGAVAREASFLTTMQRTFPNVTNVHLAPGGVGRYHLYVQMKKVHEGSAKNVIFSAFAMHHDVKQVIVVDEDIDLYNPQEVEWAVATRFQADRDLVLVDNCRASRLDPTSRGGVGSKLGMDATKPVNAPPEQFLRIGVPGRNTLDLEAVRSTLAPSAWRETCRD
ncbi:3-octaprenyl-4-hydroxybenzoate carboxy-lyase [Pigmentiphaga humi]|uniref:3-octaprenyl-4-hydroxybenzoate carboxy-lyase n=1 Tax=Pigmentiphaga humi TaxID=2478468 RepID=A0A3P4B1A6_9BURK|nr:UbiD family decarboxylase [Pigmentiphaga humi]VCU68925.1 3-octaprenyl-4-hydroxybenzoate carboxy-lyase [Pigmentiphaga humi]